MKESMKSCTRRALFNLNEMCDKVVRFIVQLAPARRRRSGGGLFGRSVDEQTEAMS